MKMPKLSTLLAICAAVIAAIIILPRIFPGLGGNFVWLLLLACPLMHLFMMKGHGHGANDAQADNHSDNHSGHADCHASGDHKQDKK
ncbi:MAG: DUF2933 domain-containing protein [Patescibacteria group bacterium]